MRPHSLVYQHGTEHLGAWQLDWTQRGCNIYIFSCFLREMGWRGKGVRWDSVYYMHGQRDRDGELGYDTTRHFSLGGLGLNAVTCGGLGLSLQQTLGACLPNSPLLSYFYACHHHHQQQQPWLTYWLPAVCFIYFSFDPHNNPRR